MSTDDGVDTAISRQTAQVVGICCTYRRTLSWEVMVFGSCHIDIMIVDLCNTS